MSKFKVGDKVRVISNPNTNMHYYMDDRSDWQAFVFDMPSMAGKVVTISSVSRYGYRIKEHEWNWTDEMFSGLATEPREFIVIRRDGSDVIASHKRSDEIVKTAKAKCAPGDEFNFDTGAKLAFDRLMGRESDEAMPRCKMPKPEPKPAHKFKVGDRVLVGNKHAGEISAISTRPQDGEPYLVYCPSIGFHSGLPYLGAVCKPEHRDKCTWQAESELSPAPEPKYYSGKVFAVRETDCGKGFQHVLARNGRVFKIEDGTFIDDKKAYGISKNVCYESFSQFCAENCLTEWAEVTE